jgi:4-hydroxybenzoate polyprenyltransferase
MNTGGFSGKAYVAYLQERFPPALNATALFLLYSCTMLAAVTLRDFPPPRPGMFLLGFGWTVAVFYHLRVLDDLKDRTADVIAYPGRVLSRGLLSYRHLAMTGLVAIAIETLIALWMGPKILALHAVTLAYSLLMYREFFIRDWLRRHLFWYGLIHMLVLSFIDFTILQMADAQGPLAHDPAYRVQLAAQRRRLLPLRPVAGQKSRHEQQQDNE